ncbi:MAG: LacI family DNA-binding transcriptional regulator [Bryobacteraceae bacterium]
MRKKPFATIRDVARLASVSVATVSGVMNKKAVARPEVQKRVEEAMKALDYHPDRMARSLKTGLSKVIGMVVPDLKNPFFVDLMCGVEEVARASGFSVIFSNSNKDQALEKENLSMLYSHRVAGAVVCSTDAYTAYDSSMTRRFPMVFVDRLPVVGFKGRAVTVDNRRAAYKATRHLIELGHQDIAIIAGRMDLSGGFERVEGFREAMQEAHLPIREEYFQSGDFSLASGYTCTLKLLSLPQRPTAIFSSNNNMTLGLMQALTDRNLSSPADISVLSYDDFPWAGYFHPKLTAVAQPGLEMGRRAVHMLQDAIQAGGEPLGEELVVLEAELIIRESTASPANRSVKDVLPERTHAVTK